jgi:murein DD-endopeptidase MepM/ murein hydrolase activator NlpD
MIRLFSKFFKIKVSLAAVLSIVMLAGIVVTCVILWGGQYITDAKYEADKQTWLSKINELESKNKDYKEQYQQVIAIKDRFRSTIKEIVEMLYNKDSHLGVGGSSTTVKDTDEAVLLEIRNTVATMQDDQNLLSEAKNYLVARKEFIESFPFTWPTIRNGVPKITSGFGFRDDLNGGKALHYHTGIDIGGEKGDKIVATADGIVTYVDYNHSLYGKFIMIKHNKYDFVTYYAHLNRILVKQGQSVKRGDKIGEMGDTGDSQGFHLHYEIRRGDIALDPMTFLNINY